MLNKIWFGEVPCIEFEYIVRMCSVYVWRARISFLTGAPLRANVQMRLTALGKKTVRGSLTMVGIISTI